MVYITLKAREWLHADQVTVVEEEKASVWVMMCRWTLGRVVSWSGSAGLGLVDAHLADFVCVDVPARQSVVFPVRPRSYVTVHCPASDTVGRDVPSST